MDAGNVDVSIARCGSMWFWTKPNHKPIDVVFIYVKPISAVFFSLVLYYYYFFAVLGYFGTVWVINRKKLWMPFYL